MVRVRRDGQNMTFFQPLASKSQGRSHSTSAALNDGPSNGNGSHCKQTRNRPCLGAASNHRVQTSCLGNSAWMEDAEFVEAWGGNRPQLGGDAFVDHRTRRRCGIEVCMLTCNEQHRSRGREYPMERSLPSLWIVNRLNDQHDIYCYYIYLRTKDAGWVQSYKAVKRQGYLFKALAVSRQNFPYPRVETRLDLSLKKHQPCRFFVLETTHAEHTTAHGTRHHENIEVRKHVCVL